MRKRIFIIGQCTLHWGRMEFGNIGNFYIVKPLFEEIRRVFPEAEIVTTMQLSDKFCQKYMIETVPMELYYDFDSDDNLEKAIQEYTGISEGTNIKTPYIEQVRRADLVIDFSGDIWGGNADFLGNDRFAVGCYKDMTARLLCPTVMLAGSPGPFKNGETMELARKAYEGFDFVSNRDPISTRLLESQGFHLENTYDYPCPSFLFAKAEEKEVEEILRKYPFNQDERIKVGFIMCGWNFKRGPFSLWPREEGEYENFVEIVKYLADKYHAHIYLISHSNGFDVPPNPFVLRHGRDFPVMEQLYQIVCNSGGYDESVTLLDGIYSPEETKAIISHFDVLISGRMHGAVAGLSQEIPTMIIDYGHEPKAHKLRGFAEICGMEGLIADPNNKKELLEKTDYLLMDWVDIQKRLAGRMERIKAEARLQFDELKKYMR